MKIDIFKNKHIGETVYIVGKGVSLNNLKSSMFGEGIIITINSSIQIVESLGLSNTIYSLQKDHYTNKVMSSTYLLTHLHESTKEMDETDIHYIFDNLNFKLTITTFSAITAIEIAKYMGCTSFVFMCFDSISNGDLHSFESENLPKYSNNYVKQKKVMLEYIRKQNINPTWITP